MCFHKNAKISTRVNIYIYSTYLTLMAQAWLLILSARWTVELPANQPINLPTNLSTKLLQQRNGVAVVDMTGIQTIATSRLQELNAAPTPQFIMHINLETRREVDMKKGFAEL